MPTIVGFGVFASRFDFFLFFLFFVFSFLLTSHTVLVHLFFESRRRFEQLVKCSVTDDLAVAQKNDFVRVRQVLQLICNENNELVFPKLLDRLLEKMFSDVGVDGRQWIVQ